LYIGFKTISHSLKIFMSDHSLANLDDTSLSLEQPDPAEASPSLRELLLFNEIATLSGRNLDVPEVLDVILRQIIKQLGVSAGMLLLWDSKSGRLSHAAAKGCPS